MVVMHVSCPSIQKFKGRTHMYIHILFWHVGRRANGREGEEVKSAFFFFFFCVWSDEWMMSKLKIPPSSSWVLVAAFTPPFLHFLFWRKNNALQEYTDKTDWWMREVSYHVHQPENIKMTKDSVWKTLITLYINFCSNLLYLSFDS